MQSQVQRIGVFGGTFDPIHLGHVRAARAACDALQLTRLIWVPNRQSPLRLDEDRTPAHHRLAMVQAAVALEEGFEVSESEVSRDGPSYLIDTLEHLQQSAPQADWVFLMGADSLDTFDRWVRAGDIVTLCDVWVMPRPGGEAQQKLAALLKRAPHFEGKIRLLEGPHTDISATEVRLRVKQGESVRDLVPQAVGDYIRDHHLYG